MGSFEGLERPREREFPVRARVQQNCDGLKIRGFPTYMATTPRLVQIAIMTANTLSERIFDDEDKGGIDPFSLFEEWYADARQSEQALESYAVFTRRSIGAIGRRRRAYTPPSWRGGLAMSLRRTVTRCQTFPRRRRPLPQMVWTVPHSRTASEVPFFLASK